MRWRLIAPAALATIAVAGGVLWWAGLPAPFLTVATWSGPYGRAQANAIFQPFAATGEATIRIANYDGGISELRRQVLHKRHDWDVADLELPDAVKACKAGLLEKIDPAMLPPSPRGVPASGDFVPGAIGPCWVGSVVYSQIIAFAPALVAGPRPETIEDFFDTRRYPGPRGLRRDSAKFNLELALLADGVKAQDVYATLQTRAGLARALAKLDTIRPLIRWWDSPRDARQMLRSRAVVFTTMLNGDAFDAAMAREKPGLIWDRQLYEFDVFAIPKGTPKAALARDFIVFATGPNALARMGEWVPYGPARKSAVALVGRNPDLHVAMRTYLPTAPENFKTAFRVNDVWWNRHGAAVAPLWRAWLNGTKPADIAKPLPEKTASQARR